LEFLKIFLMSTYKEFQEDFKGLVENDKLSHAYLFFGRERGNKEKKFIFAQSLANFLENGIFNQPEKLLSESLIVSSDAKGTIGIDAIRYLKHFLWQKPTNSLRKTAIIKEAESLTPEAQNSALKILEEPPKSALIIFVADAEENLFPTLISRLQKIYFPSEKIIGDLGQPTINPDELEKIDSDKIDVFFESLIGNFQKNPVKNYRNMKETLSRLILMKQFNTNKRLQLRALLSSISDKKH
jgi:DNA polymerase III delta prime subunit